MLPGGVEGAKAKAAESDNGFTSDSLSKDFEFWNKIDGTSRVLREHNQAKNFQSHNDTLGKTHRCGIFVILE